ncbi:MAG TPA: hydantoinase/oxoprolinase family protein [Stellaceae bacterium]|jgi:N-methylhydantoinase A|nr:hydantoinase/oxoprolinase family protein [Stellaceae bacterium]
MAWQIGVDVGGTFTDLLALDLEVGEFRVAKVPSTPEDQSIGFIAGLAALGVDNAAVSALVHGTTVATNAVLERKGARCGLITTAGFRDVLELGRRTRPNPYGMTGSFEALIPRELRVEVAERVDAAGRIVTPLDEDAVRDAARLLRERGAEALVIHFIHSYANPAHERRCAEIAREIWPNRFVTLGSEILREVREFERGSTAALNGYVQPIVSRYLGRLSQNLRSAGLANDLLVMQGNGGMMAVATATDLAVQTVMSGPAAGAIAAARIGVQAGLPNLVACDMGGTSFDVSLIAAGEPALSAEKDIAYGVPLRVPLVDIHTIGAGGGSIARITRAGLLQVGPESAGARPGPIAYGRGGTFVTVTDANLMLGRLNPDRLTGVAAVAALQIIGAALKEQVGDPLGLDTTAAAAAVLAVTTNQLAHAIRLVSVEKGHDPRDFALFAFGGAGPLHAVEIARELGIPTVLVPRFPGITSGLGCVLADVRHDFVQSVGQALADVVTEDIDARFAEQAAAGKRLLDEDGVPLVETIVRHEADLLFRGQSHVFRVPVASPGFDPAHVLADFMTRYKARFDIELPEMKAMLANLRTTVIGRRGDADLTLFAPPADAADAAKPVGTRRVYFRNEWFDTAIYDRAGLARCMRLAGPAIVEQPDTTVVIDPGATATVDHLGNLVISVGDA